MGSSRRAKAARRKARVHLPIFKEAGNDALDRFQRASERLGDEVGEAARGAGAQCKAGCHGCCYQLIALDFVEALLIARWLRSRGRTTVELIDKLIEQAKAQQGFAREEWFHEAKPCVFLNEQKQCSIHPVRPLACRTYFVTTDPKLCHPDAGLQTVTTFTASIDAHFRLVGVARRGVFTGAHAESIAMGPLAPTLLAAIDFLDRGLVALDQSARTVAGDLPPWMKATASK